MYDGAGFSHFHSHLFQCFIAGWMTAGNSELNDSEPSTCFQQTKGFFRIRSTPQEVYHCQVLTTSVSDILQEAIEHSCICEGEAICGIKDMKCFHIDLFAYQENGEVIGFDLMKYAPVRVLVLRIRYDRIGTESVVKVNASAWGAEWTVIEDLGQAD